MENRMNEMMDQEMKQKKASTLYHAALIAGVLAALYSAVMILPNNANGEGILMTLIAMPVMFLLVGGVPYGWIMVSKVTKYIEWFLILPIIGWLIYFTLKLTAAAYIGWFFFIRALLSDMKQRKMQKAEIEK